MAAPVLQVGKLCSFAGMPGGKNTGGWVLAATRARGVAATRCARCLHLVQCLGSCQSHSLPLKTCAHTALAGPVPVPQWRAPTALCRARGAWSARAVHAEPAAPLLRCPAAVEGPYCKMLDPDVKLSLGQTMALLFPAEDPGDCFSGC